ncbi:hypothetical protein PI125_g11666 [Phytophthora idaei]|nr:hypothetical protein PI125_g11666 [Phytophthora idaei]
MLLATSGSDSPILAEYTALGGDDTLKGMTSFSAPELDVLWALAEPVVMITSLLCSRKTRCSLRCQC